MNSSSTGRQLQNTASFKIYGAPSSSYHHFVNRACQSKTKMIGCSSKKAAFIIANKFWEQSKDDKVFVDTYINPEPTNPIQETKNNNQNLLTTFFSKAPANSNINNNNIFLEKLIAEPEQSQNIVNDPPLDNNERESKKRKSDLLNQKPLLHDNIKQNKKSHHHYDLKLIVDYLFSEEHLASDVKLNIESDLLKDIILNENLYISLTQYIEQKSLYDKMSKFKKKNESTQQIERIEIAVKIFGKLLLEGRLIRLQTQELISGGLFSELRNRESMIQYETQLSELKTKICFNMVDIASLIGLVLPTLSKRVRNVRNYKKSSLAPVIYHAPLKFMCFNLDSDWEFSKKLLSLIASENGNVYPLE